MALGHITIGGPSVRQSSISFTLDGGGAALTTGIKGDLIVPATCQVQSWEVLADQSGSVVVDIWKDVYANFPPTVTGTITGTDKPTLSSAAKAQSGALTGWTVNLSAGDILRFNVNSAATVTRVTVTLLVLASS